MFTFNDSLRDSLKSYKKQNFIQHEFTNRVNIKIHDNSLIKNRKDEIQMRPRNENCLLHLPESATSFHSFF